MSGSGYDPFDVTHTDQPYDEGRGGLNPDFARNLLAFGAAAMQGANARTAGGFLANGTGPLGGIGAGIQGAMQQNLAAGRTRSELAYQGAQTQHQQMQNQLMQMGMPYQLALQNMNLKLLDPKNMRDYMHQFGIDESGGASGDSGSSYASSIGSMEGGAKTDATNPAFPVERGGPLGQHQFIASTWEGFAKANPQYFANMTQDQVLAARADPKLSGVATDWLAQQNAPILAQNGIKPTGPNLAIAHALGGQGAAAILKYPDDTPISQAIGATFGPQAAAILTQNPQYQRLTVGQMRQHYARVPDPQQAAADQSAPYQVAQAGNAPLPSPGQQPPQGAPQQAAQASQMPQPPGPDVGLTAQANALTRRAGQIEALQKNLTSRGLPLPPMDDPAALRQQASQLNQAALAPRTAAAEAAAKLPFTPLEARQGAMVWRPDMGWVKNPQYEQMQDEKGNTLAGHVVPGTPGTNEPGRFEPVLGQDGKPLITKLPANVTAARTKAYDDFVGKDTDNFISASNTQGVITQMNEAAKVLNQASGFLNTGPNAPIRLAFANRVNDVLRTGGLPAAFDPNALGSWEELVKSTKTAGFELASHYEGHARQAAATIDNATTAVPSERNTEVGFAKVSSGINEIAQFAKDLHTSKMPVYKASGDLPEAEFNFVSKYPPQMYARRAISTVTPYEVTKDNEINRYLPGTIVSYKGKKFQVPDRDGAPAMPDYLKDTADLLALRPDAKPISFGPIQSGRQGVAR